MQIKNKKLLIKKSIYYFFGFLPLIITLFVYPHIPDQIPSHYNDIGEIMKWDNKIKVLIIPFLLAIFICIKPKIFNQNFETETENRISDGATMLLILSVNLLNILELYTSIMGADFLSKFNFYNLLSCLICFAFICLGNIFSNCTRNSTFSIKVPMHLMDDKKWQNIHHNLGSYWISSSAVFLLISILCVNDYIFEILILDVIFIILIPLLIMYIYIKKNKKN